MMTETDQIHQEYKEWDNSLQEIYRLATIAAKQRGYSNKFAAIHVASKRALRNNTTTFKVLKQWAGEYE